MSGATPSNPSQKVTGDDVVLAAVNQNGLALQHASNGEQSDDTETTLEYSANDCYVLVQACVLSDVLSHL